ncbi:MAG: prepilin-type N-terminal cleavage/methylation domain-containing protein [Phycisphaerales bacterium]|nr:prepilin-type N-terminal cleavage/methylation domain-containing protein [Phycisphaerales bacterium]
MSKLNVQCRRTVRTTPRCRRGFNLVELMIALAITAALLAATMVALNASFVAYQRTAEEASTHTIARLALHRMLVLIRTGSDFGPFPVDPTQSVITSDTLEFRTPGGKIVTLSYDPDAQNLSYGVLDEGTGVESVNVLLNGVAPILDADGVRIKPFTLEYELGHKLYRATIDLSVIADDDANLDMEGDYVGELRLVASAMPRSAAYGE